MLTYKFGERQVKVPVSWDEVSVDKYLKLRSNSKLIESGDPIALISILCDLEYDYLFNLRTAPADLDNFVAALSWFADVPDFGALPVPLELVIDDKPYKVPSDITSESVGKKIVFEQKVVAESENNADVAGIMDEALAIYFYSAFAGKTFDPDDLDGIKKAVRKCGITQAYPVANFFFNQLNEIVKVEQETLAIAPEAEESQAGIEELSKFGVMSVIRNLAKGDVTKVEDVLAQPYNVVLSFQQQGVAEQLYQRRLRNVYKNKTA